MKEKIVRTYYRNGRYYDTKQIDGAKEVTYYHEHVCDECEKKLNYRPDGPKINFGGLIIPAPYYGMEMLCEKRLIDGFKYNIPIDTHDTSVFESRQWNLSQALNFLGDNGKPSWTTKYNGQLGITDDHMDCDGAICVTSMSPYYQSIGRIEKRNWDIGTHDFINENGQVVLTEIDSRSYDCIKQGRKFIVKDAIPCKIGKGRYYYKEIYDRRIKKGLTLLENDEVDAFVYPGKGNFFTVNGRKNYLKFPLGFFRIKVGDRYYIEDESSTMTDSVEFRMMTISSMMAVPVPSRQARWKAGLEMHHSHVFGEIHVFNFLNQ